MKSSAPIPRYPLRTSAPNTPAFVIETMQRMEERRLSAADIPHRHEYYVVILIEHAKGTHTIDFCDFTIEPHTVFFLHPGQVHALEVKPNPRGTAILFSDEFLSDTGIRPAFMEKLALFRDYHYAPVRIPLDTRAELQMLVESLQREAHTPTEHSIELIGAYLQALFIVCNRCKSAERKKAPSITGTGHRHLRAFQRLIDEHFAVAHKVADYAAMMNISAHHLNDTLKQATGKSAKTLIQDRLILEAKRSAVHTDCTLSEIASHLGYDDPAHFSRFFKKCAGVSFMHFKREIHEKYK